MHHSIVDLETRPPGDKKQRTPEAEAIRARRRIINSLADSINLDPVLGIDMKKETVTLFEANHVARQFNLETFEERRKQILGEQDSHVIATSLITARELTGKPTNGLK